MFTRFLHPVIRQTVTRNNPIEWQKIGIRYQAAENRRMFLFCSFYDFAFFDGGHISGRVHAYSNSCNVKRSVTMRA